MTSGREPGPVGPALARGGTGSGTGQRDWPLRSRLELGAFPGAVPCARLHVRQLIWEWRLRALAETAELIVSELVTNAVKAAAGLASAGQQEAGRVILVLASDRSEVLVSVWDGSSRPPSPPMPTTAPSPAAACFWSAH